MASDSTHKRGLEFADNGQQPAKVQRTLEMKMDDYSCPVCKELLYEPRTFTCGHSFCFICMRKLFDKSSGPDCPVCRANQRTFGHRNVMLCQILGQAFATEYALRKNECGVDEWLQQKKEMGQDVLLTSMINMDKTILLSILHALDKKDVLNSRPSRPLIASIFTPTTIVFWSTNPSAAYVVPYGQQFCITWEGKQRETSVSLMAMKTDPNDKNWLIV